MNRYLRLCILIFICLIAFVQCSDDISVPNSSNIIAGIGWDRVYLGAIRKDAEKVVGKGQEGHRFDDVYYINYPTKGIEICYTINDNKIFNIYFFNKDKEYEYFNTFEGKTNKGINWESSVDDVIKAYGTPKENHEFENGQRMVFNGIDFRFIDGVMVRIGIPGK